VFEVTIINPSKETAHYYQILRNYYGKKMLVIVSYMVIVRQKLPK
jgi:hypothetical protein